MFSETVIRGIPFRPARFCAPLAALTHITFRQLMVRDSDRLDRVIGHLKKRL
jgi:hypothetical protein